VAGKAARMTVNPYEPPQAPTSSPLPVEVDRAGPWRDHALMVVRVNNSGPLPWRCVITGVPVEPHQLFLHQLTYYPKTHSFLLAQPVTFAFYWPVVDAARPWVIPLRFRQGVGLFSGVVCAIATGFVPGVPQPIQVISFFSLIPLLALVAICEVIDRQMTRRFPSILRAQDGYAWVQGVHADFLAALPPWPGGEPK
jgi:hypothetical protein